MHNRLKLYRKRNGLSQEDVAKQLNMSRTTLTAIESGKRAVKVDELPLFAKLYGVSLDLLVYGDSLDPLRDALLVEFSKLKNEDKIEVIKFAKFKGLNSHMSEVIDPMEVDIDELVERIIKGMRK